MTLEPQRREAEEDRPPVTPPEQTGEAERLRQPGALSGPPAPLRVPSPRLSYASPDLELPREAGLPGDRLLTLTHAALTALGGEEERAGQLVPEEDLLTRLVNDETLDLTPRSDLTPLIPEEQSRNLSGQGRQEGQAFEEDYRREAELKPDDLEEIGRERRELVREYHAQQGHALLDPAELSRLVGPPEQLAGQQAGQVAPSGQAPAGQDPQPAPRPGLPELLRSEAGERALQAVTQRLATGFQHWLRQEGHWHKRSEWLKKHLTRVWEYAPDALNPHTLLLAPRGRSRFASFVQAEAPEADAPGQTERQGGGRPEQDRNTRQDELKARTRKSARSGQFERHIKDARRLVVLATSKTIARNWAEARDPAWHLDATADDVSAPLKSPQNRALDAWLNSTRS